MGGIALLARELGYRVTGSDANVYPPMSTQLEAAGITLAEGYAAEQLQPAPDVVVVGNAMTRGNPAVEYMLNAGLAYTSGPQWLAENVLRDKWVLAVAGTHGKTTTSSLLAWILDYAGMAPGFLIGGVPANFGLSARGGDSGFFVVEADEYDTAFFDKRSKFVHYRPRTVVVNNLEFDHADIFPDLAAIQRQFHHLMRCVPGEGLVVHPRGVAAIDDVLAMGCWTPAQTFAIDGAADWAGELLAPDAASFMVAAPGGASRRVDWGFLGRHNAENALAAIAAAHHVGVPLEHAVAAVCAFRGVKRRLELLGQIGGVSVYDDFAHHPTAIATTLQGLRASGPEGRLIALIEPRSNTMRMGEHRARLAQSVRDADQVFWFQPAGMNWSLEEVIADSPVPASLSTDVRQLARQVTQQARPGDRVVIMSNGGFGGIHQILLDELQAANS
jgi:UDP-N-acetylmuramate: L-alanyl-gamma-D-glutamyl-meso-diaminopimelate ligase